MNFRLTAILILVMLALVGGLLFVVLIDDKPSTDAVLMAPLAGLKADDVDVIELVRTEPAEEKLVFVRAGKDRWELRDGNAGRLDSAAVNRTVETLMRLKPTPSTELTGDPAKHGLDKPSLKATLKSKHGTGTLLIGDTTVGEDSAITFVASGDRPKVPVAVKRSDIAGLFRENTKSGTSAKLTRWAADYRLKRLLGVDLYDITAQAKQIKINAGGKELAFSRVSGSEWKFDAPPGYGLVDTAGDSAPQPHAITGLRPLVTMFSTLSAMDASDFIEKPEPLTAYGLDAGNKDLVRIEIVPNEGPPDVVLIGKQVPDAKPTKYYAMVPGEPVVVKVLGERIDALVKTVADPKSLQDRTLVKELDVPRVDAVSITAGGTKADLRKVTVGPQQRWVVYGSSEPQFAGAAVQALLQAIAQPRVALEALAAPADAMFAANEVKAEIKLWLDGIAEKIASKDDAIPPEPKLKGTANATFIFGKVDGDKAFCRRILADGSKIDFLVPSSLTALASKKRGEYFDLKFKDFATNLARKLSFNRGGEQFELDRSEKGDLDFPNGKWTFAKPDAMKGKVADAEIVNHLVGNLATLSAESVASEKPSETELAIMGLDPAHPRLKAIITLADEKDKERTFDFGNETPDKAYVYFKNPAKKTTYLVPRVTIDQMLTADLRDRTPYRFDTKDVKSIVLRGWKTKPVKELTLVRDGENWTAQGMPPSPANPLAMMNLLNHFRAPKPVAVIGGQTPEQGFDAAKGGDPLEVKLNGEKGLLVQYTLGNTTDGGARIYAWNDATQEVITLPTAMFMPFKDGPEMFKK